MGDNILEIKNLSKNFKDFSLNNLNLIMKRSEAGLNGVYVIGADKHIYTPEQRIMVLQLIR